MEAFWGSREEKRLAWEGPADRPDSRAGPQKLKGRIGARIVSRKSNRIFETVHLPWVLALLIPRRRQVVLTLMDSAQKFAELQKTSEELSELVGFDSGRLPR